MNLVDYDIIVPLPDTDAVLPSWAPSTFAATVATEMMCQLPSLVGAGR